MALSSASSVPDGTGAGQGFWARVNRTNAPVSTDFADGLQMIKGALVMGGCAESFRLARRAVTAVACVQPYNNRVPVLVRSPGLGIAGVILTTILAASGAGCAQMKMAGDLNNYERTFDSRLRVNESGLGLARIGVGYEERLPVVGGAPPYRWKLISGALPEGLVLDEVSGTINGTPTESGSFAITLIVRGASREESQKGRIQRFVIEIE